MAKKVEHQGVLFPAPTRALLEGMAVAGHAAFVNTIGLEIDAKIKGWDDTNDHVRTAWYDSSRAMYAMLAVAAGAKVTELPIKKEGKDPK